MLALPALALMLCAGPAANATLVSSSFHNDNLSDNLPTNPNGWSSGLTGFSVVPSAGNNLPGTDSIAFSVSQTGAAYDRYIRGTSDPTNPAHVGLASIVRAPFQISPLVIAPLATTHTITFNSAEPISEIVLSVLSLRDSRVLSFAGPTASDISGVTGNLTLAGGTVGAAPGSNSSSAGSIVWTFDTPVTNPTLQFTFTGSGLSTEVHFSNISYTTVAAIPEPMSFVWFATAFGLVQYGRRRRMDATLAD